MRFGRSIGFMAALASFLKNDFFSMRFHNITNFPPPAGYAGGRGHTRSAPKTGRGFHGNADRSLRGRVRWSGRKLNSVI